MSKNKNRKANDNGSKAAAVRDRHGHFAKRAENVSIRDHEKGLLKHIDDLAKRFTEEKVFSMADMVNATLRMETMCERLASDAYRAKTEMEKSERRAEFAFKAGFIASSAVFILIHVIIALVYR